MAFLSRVFGRAENKSGDVAKERLRKVLITDRSKVSPQMMEEMRGNLTRVLSEFMDVDEANSHITINSNDRDVSLVANIPIRRMKRSKG